QGSAVRHLEDACRLAPESWETHRYLARALSALAREHGNPQRLVERSQFHIVRAHALDLPPGLLGELMKDLGVTCLLTGRLREAERVFIRLREHEEHAEVARYFLGQVAYQLGKYNNAVQHFRHYLRASPDDANVIARMSMAWFQAGDFARAREGCHQALMVDPGNVVVRHTLGCTLLEEGEPHEAVKVFRATLKDCPEHMVSYLELARTKRQLGNSAWLIEALRSEVGDHDRLPAGGELDARRITRSRIQIVLGELREVGPSMTHAVLGAIDRTQDEALRFQLWEAACALSMGAVADHVGSRLQSSGRNYAPSLGAETLAAAHAVPEPILRDGLKVEESDVKRAAVERHGPAEDVDGHRRNLALERNRVRAYQALLLLAVASRRSPAGRDLLRSWTSSVDPQLAVAAWAGLAMYGDPGAEQELKAGAARKGALRLVERLLRQVTPSVAESEPHTVTGEEVCCSTCGRRTEQVVHLIAGGTAVICDQCMIHVGRHRVNMSAGDGALCDLCGRTQFDVHGLYSYNRVNVCSECLDMSLGMLERQEVDEFLATW
ncbi:MAG: ClpX C4-type zinc finger protein, partial [Myxococcota bacterium]|nr:ClpX C4-type zinc finger protein [Myxococcota bacterium]